MKSKIGSAILSVLIAFGMWLYVITAVSPGSMETYDDIPIVWDGESVLNEKGLMITRVSSDTVTLKLSGNRSDLTKVNRGNITIKVDLSKIYEPGNHILFYNPAFPGDVPSNAFVIESKSPDSISVTVARRITKTVPVEVNWTGSVAEGFMTDRENRVLDYPAISVTGPDSVVNTIEKATIDVDLTERRESISEDYQYTLCDAEGNPVDAKLITTDAEKVHLEVAIRRIKDLRLTYTLVEGGGASAHNTSVTLSTEPIRVSGSEAALELMGDTLDIGTINLAELTKNTTLEFPVVLPEGVTNLTGVTEVTAEVHFNGLTTRELTVENIQSINIPEGLKVDIITKKLTITVRGTAAQVNKLTANDVTVTVDFTGAEAGTSTFKATIVYGEGFENVGTLRADPVSARIDPAV